MSKRIYYIDLRNYLIYFFVPANYEEMLLSARIK